MPTPPPPPAIEGRSVASLTLLEMVDEPVLGLGVVVAGDLSRPVQGAHAIEIDHPARWLQPGSAMLTTGLRFVGASDGAAGEDELVEELAGAGVVALLFGIGVHFDEVPARLVLAARRRDFTLLTINASTPFHAVEDYVNRSRLSSETRSLKRTLRLHEDLLRALAADDPVSALIKRLGILGQGSAFLYDSGGHAIAATGEAPQRLIWQEIARTGEGSGTFAVGRWSVASRSLTIDGAQLYVVVASRSATVIAELGETLLSTTVHILAAANGIRSVTLTHQKAEASRLIAALEGGLSSSRIRQTWQRLGPFRLRAGDPLRYLVASSVPSHQVLTARRPTDELLELAHRTQLGLLLHEIPRSEDVSHTVTALVRDAPALQQCLEVFGQTHTVGLSSRFFDLVAVPAQVREAQAAWRLISGRYERGNRTTVLRMEDLDLASWVIATRDDGEVQAMIRRQISVLDDAPDLRETLVVFLAQDQDLRRTANTLYVHVNTVRYRLQKAEKRLGVTLSSAAAITNLYLALQDEILGAQASS